MIFLQPFRTNLNRYAVNFAEKIRSFIKSIKKTGYSSPDIIPFDFVKTKKGMFRELMISKQANNIIGVFCKAFGEGMFLTAVEDLEEDMNSKVIVFHPYDITGRLLRRTRIDLREIEMVCPFNKTYKNPLSSEKVMEYVEMRSFHSDVSIL
jgi:hypothetical protein